MGLVWSGQAGERAHEVFEQFWWRLRRRLSHVGAEPRLFRVGGALRRVVASNGFGGWVRGPPPLGGGAKLFCFFCCPIVGEPTLGWRRVCEAVSRRFCLCGIARVLVGCSH
ncbi:unnamed protein product [Tuber melanosporum]|uniref:(Perigord truffle) hypothetical protein n=1 Tax=Tuber melanosporum (strain Mel28) TaxID=656061 RepID=D5GG82_TUBMM|nr:uncharacterized protein GSTUM_00001996001 [Tuber melanosporum]CAZ83525.1 unnamed protein product [Tuber melanosporum]